MKFKQMDLFGGATPPEKKPRKAPAAAPSAAMPPPEETTPSLPPPTETPPPQRTSKQKSVATSPAKHPPKTGQTSGKPLASIELPPDEVLYIRQYYSIGEVAAMFQVNVSVLRYWESTFEVLDLRKNRKGDRFFRPDDIKTVRLIHHLLRERRFTIEGAREYIRNHARAGDRFEAIELLRRIKGYLAEIKQTLGSKSSTEG